jgi:hypothetical protein
MKQVLNSGDEYDCVSKRFRSEYSDKPAGYWKRIKRQLNKRFRKDSKAITSELI